MRDVRQAAVVIASIIRKHTNSNCINSKTNWTPAHKNDRRRLPLHAVRMVRSLSASVGGCLPPSLPLSVSLSVWPTYTSESWLKSQKSVLGSHPYMSITAQTSLHVYIERYYFSVHCWIACWTACEPRPQEAEFTVMNCDSINQFRSVCRYFRLWNCNSYSTISKLCIIFVYLLTRCCFCSYANFTSA